MLPDVMAVCVHPGHDIETCSNRCRFLRWIRRTRTTACAPRRTSTPRGVNDPHRRWPGAARATQHRGRSRPLSDHRLGAHALGRHTAPSDLDDLDAENLLSLSVFGPLRWRELRAHWRRQRAWRFECWGQVHFGHLSPAWRDSHRNQGKRLRLHRTLATASTAEHVTGVAGAIGRK
jgi:hypothetical protein